VQGCSKVFQKVDSILAGYFSKLVELDLHDLESVQGKSEQGSLNSSADYVEGFMPDGIVLRENLLSATTARSVIATMSRGNVVESGGN
jgi:hypothetical protein